MLELDAPAVRPPIVDDEDAEILERALEHTSASIPRRAGGRKLVERVGALGNPKTIYATERVVERARRDRGRSGRLPYRCRHHSRGVAPRSSPAPRQAHRGRLPEGGATLIVDLAGNRLEAIPLKLEFARTRLADGNDDAASVRRRFREACAAFGTEVAEEVGCLVASWR